MDIPILAGQYGKTNDYVLQVWSHLTRNVFHTRWRMEVYTPMVIYVFWSHNNLSKPPRSHSTRNNLELCLRLCHTRVLVGCAAPLKLGNEIRGESTEEQHFWNMSIHPGTPLSNFEGGGNPYNKDVQNDLPNLEGRPIQQVPLYDKVANRTPGYFLNKWDRGGGTNNCIVSPLGTRFEMTSC